jgi:hypothetical protein
MIRVVRPLRMSIRKNRGAAEGKPKSAMAMMSRDQIAP